MSEPGDVFRFIGFQLRKAGLVAKQCRFELDNGSGATMRVQLVGYDAADVEALSRSLWDAL